MTNKSNIEIIEEESEGLIIAEGVIKYIANEYTNCFPVVQMGNDPNIGLNFSKYNGKKGRLIFIEDKE